MLQKISFPHIVDKVVNKSASTLDIVYNSIFEHIVFYLNKHLLSSPAPVVLDLQNPLIYNVLVYVLMEFRGRENTLFTINKQIKGERNEEDISA